MQKEKGDDKRSLSYLQKALPDYRATWLEWPLDNAIRL